MNNQFVNFLSDYLATIDPLATGALGGGIFTVLGILYIYNSKRKKRKLNTSANTEEIHDLSFIATKDFEQNMQGFTLETKEFDTGLNPKSLIHHPTPANMWQHEENTNILDSPINSDIIKTDTSNDIVISALQSDDLLKLAMTFDEHHAYENAHLYLLKAVDIEEDEKENLRLRVIAQDYKKMIDIKDNPDISLQRLIDKLPSLSKRPIPIVSSNELSVSSMNVSSMDSLRVVKDEVIPSIASLLVKSDVQISHHEKMNGTDNIFDEIISYAPHTSHEASRPIQVLEKLESSSWLDEQADLANLQIEINIENPAIEEIIVNSQPIELIELGEHQQPQSNIIEKGLLWLADSPQDNQEKESSSLVIDNLPLLMEKLAQEAEEQDRLIAEEDNSSQETYLANYHNNEQFVMPILPQDDNSIDKNQDNEKFLEEFGSVIVDLDNEVKGIKKTHLTNQHLWVNWMLQDGQQSIMKKSIIEIIGKWGTKDSIEQLTESLNQEAGMSVEGIQNTWAMLSVTPITD